MEMSKKEPEVRRWKNSMLFAKNKLDRPTPNKEEPTNNKTNTSNIVKAKAKELIEEIKANPGHKCEGIRCAQCFNDVLPFFEEMMKKMKKRKEAKRAAKAKEIEEEKARHNASLEFLDIILEEVVEKLDAPKPAKAEVVTENYKDLEKEMKCQKSAEEFLDYVIEAVIEKVKASEEKVKGQLEKEAKYQAAQDMLDSINEDAVERVNNLTSERAAVESDFTDESILAKPEQKDFLQVYTEITDYQAPKLEPATILAKSAIDKDVLLQDVVVEAKAECAKIAKIANIEVACHTVAVTDAPQQSQYEEENEKAGCFRALRRRISRFFRNRLRIFRRK